MITHLAGYGFLAGLILVYARAGSFVWTDPAVAAAFTGGVAALFIVSAMAKSVMYPAAHVDSGGDERADAGLRAAAFGLLRKGRRLPDRPHVFVGHGRGTRRLACRCWRWAASTMLVGVIFALAQNRPEAAAGVPHDQPARLYRGGTSHRHPDLGVAAGLFYCLSHALFKGTLFMCAGSVQHATGTRDLRQLGGLAAGMPDTTRGSGSSPPPPSSGCR